jgi:cytidylate kinase
LKKPSFDHLMPPIIVTIDGYCSCGKSTLARDLAKELGYKYVDTGAMYRAVTLYLLRQRVNLEDEDAVRKILPEVSIDFKYAPQTNEQLTHLNGENVEEAIRSIEVSHHVSQVSTLRAVRETLVKQQKGFGTEKGIVMDGRDIGTVVFPDAELKLFLTASSSIRTKRRYDELKDAGEIVTIEEVHQNLEERDHMDATRSESPLRQAADAIVLDNTHMSREEQLAYARDKAYAIMTQYA